MAGRIEEIKKYLLNEWMNVSLCTPIMHSPQSYSSVFIQIHQRFLYHVFLGQFCDIA